MRKVDTLDREHRIEFTAGALAPDTFTVIKFSGQEGLSKLYRFEVDLVSENAAVDLKAMLAHPAALKVVQGSDTTMIHGVLSVFEALQQQQGDTFYRAVLVPRLWRLSLYRVNEVYVDKSTKEIIELVLKDAGLTSNDYELSLTGTYPKWEHLCQYQETHFDFISRLMERDGIYYYFAQDANRAKLVITDARTRHEPVAAGKKIKYQPGSGLVADAEQQIVYALVCRQKPLPQKLIVMDYNYRSADLDLKKEVAVDAQNGHGSVYLYGEHVNSQAESTRLAQIRVEELCCRERTFHGESTCSILACGYLIEMEGHFRQEFNQSQLVVELSHAGSQAGVVLSGGAGTEGAIEQEPFYRNSFTSIPHALGLQFRPERHTPIPKIHGSMHAFVDAEGSGEYAELDADGRYKIRLPFDRAPHEAAKASQWIRMAQPYAGKDHGMHFPLHKTAEVLLTYIDGDPNRPIIAAAMPNSGKVSVVTHANEKTSVIKTAGGNLVVLDDTDPSQYILLQTKGKHSLKFDDAEATRQIELKTTAKHGLLLDDKNKKVELNSTAKNSLLLDDDTKKAELQTTGKHSLLLDDTNKKVTLTSTGANKIELDDTSPAILLSHNAGAQTMEFNVEKGGTIKTLGMHKDETFTGDHLELTIGSTDEILIGHSSEIKVAQTEGISLANNTEIAVGGKEEIYIGAKFEMTIAASLEMSAGPKTELESAGGIKFKPAFEAETAVNSLKTKVNEIATTTNDIVTKVNEIQSATTEISTKVTKIQTGAITMIA